LPLLRLPVRNRYDLPTLRQQLAQHLGDPQVDAPSPQSASNRFHSSRQDTP
jgi:hypothetical protein